LKAPKIRNYPIIVQGKMNVFDGWEKLGKEIGSENKKKGENLGKKQKKGLLNN